MLKTTALRSIATLVVCATTSGVGAQDKKDEKKADAPAATSSGTNGFWEGWAVGLAVIKPKQASVGEATIVDGVVRSDKRASQEASLLVARHFYPFSDKRRCGEGDGVSGVTTALLAAGRCVGAMVGVGLGTAGGSGDSQLINFAGIGLTIGGGVYSAGKTNWNFGVGVGRKFNAKVLGDGFKEGAPPPGTETQVRYKTVDTEAKFIYFSTSW